jgi:hypothetical protein
VPILVNECADFSLDWNSRREASGVRAGKIEQAKDNSNYCAEKRKRVTECAECGPDLNGRREAQSGQCKLLFECKTSMFHLLLIVLLRDA